MVIGPTLRLKRKKRRGLHVSSSYSRRSPVASSDNGQLVASLRALVGVVVVVAVMVVGGVHLSRFDASHSIPELDQFVAVNNTKTAMTKKLNHVQWLSLSDNKSRPIETIQLNYTRKSRRLWPEDPPCSWAEVRFGMRLGRVWLLSFPRSGNTWTRYLLEAAAGIFTSSIYNSSHLRTLGYLGEGEPSDSGTTLVVKTHSLAPLTRHPHLPVVALVRSPARAILSYWNYNNIDMKWRKFAGSVKTASYKTTGFHKFVWEKLEKWRWTYEYALRNTTRLHLMYYENLREAPLREIRALLAFLGVKPSEARLACLARHLEGGVKGAQREVLPYSNWEMVDIQGAVAQVDSLARERGFPPLPDYSRYKN
ncbi:WSCD family member AGAP003962-like [Panulirus ornatus]|uniref:WSCD family member AGAP003962-like n=1 Tax=Panulirus ornatus TaxID=150431 RepID=UPI003A83D826